MTISFPASDRSYTIRLTVSVHDGGITVAYVANTAPPDGYTFAVRSKA